MQISGSSAGLNALKAQQAWEARRAQQAGQAQPTLKKQPIQTGAADAAQTVKKAASTPYARIQHAQDKAKTAPSEPVQKSPAVETPQSLSGVTASQWDAWRKTVEDIQQIASQAGFVGVSERDIRNAYTHGESLLVDYRV